METAADNQEFGLALGAVVGCRDLSQSRLWNDGS